MKNAEWRMANGESVQCGGNVALRRRVAVERCDPLGFSLAGAVAGSVMPAVRTIA